MGLQNGDVGRNRGVLIVHVCTRERERERERERWPKRYSPQCPGHCRADRWLVDLNAKGIVQ